MEGEFICSLSSDLSVLMSLFKRYWERGWWLWELVLFPSLSLFLPGDSLFAGRRVFRICFHACLFYAPALLLCECSEPFRSADANEMYHWPHNPAALNTLLCVHMATDLKHTHTLNPSLPQTCVRNVKANLHHCFSQVSSSQLLFIITLNF